MMGLLGWFSSLRRSLENPSTSLSNPAAWLVRMFSAEADSGVAITADTALGIPTFWQCVRLLTDDFAKLPTIVYKSNDEEGHQRAPRHPAYHLLRRKANKWMTAGVFKRTILHHALLWGNGYAYIVRDEAARPIELLLLRPDQTTPFLHNGNLWYETWINGERRILKSDEVFHLHGLGFDGIKGYSIIKYAANSLGLTIAAEKYGSKHFANGSRASGVLQYPGRLKQEGRENLRKSFEEAHQGLDNAHRTVLLEEGAKFIPLTIPPNEAQFIELRELQRKEVGSWFKIPPSKLGDPDSVSYNSLEQWNQAYLEGALDPWLVAFEDEAFDKLLTETQKRHETHFVEFTRAALLRTDLKSRYEAYRIGREGGWLSVNRILRKENEPPIGPEGDLHLTPMNFANLKTLLAPPPTDDTADENDNPSDDATKPGQEGDQENDADRSHRMSCLQDALVGTFGRAVRRSVGVLTKAAKKTDFANKLPELLEECRDHFEQMVSPLLRVMSLTEEGQWINATSLAEAHLADLSDEVRAVAPTQLGEWGKQYESVAVARLVKTAFSRAK
jgi:HK97 family phage portal protein